MEVKGPTNLRIEAETNCHLADVAVPSTWQLCVSCQDTLGKRRIRVTPAQPFLVTASIASILPLD